MPLRLCAWKRSLLFTLWVKETIDFSKSTVPHNKFTKSARDRVLSTKEENDARKLLHLKSVDLYDAGKIKPNFSRKKEVIRVWSMTI